MLIAKASLKARYVSLAQSKLRFVASRVAGSGADVSTTMTKAEILLRVRVSALWTCEMTVCAILLPSQRIADRSSIGKKHSNGGCNFQGDS